MLKSISLLIITLALIKNGSLLMLTLNTLLIGAEDTQTPAGARAE
jgi:hypothetical protein